MSEGDKKIAARMGGGFLSPSFCIGFCLRAAPVFFCAFVRAGDRCRARPERFAADDADAVKIFVYRSVFPALLHVSAGLRPLVFEERVSGAVRAVTLQAADYYVVFPATSALIDRSKFSRCAVCFVLPFSRSFPLFPAVRAVISAWATGKRFAAGFTGALHER